MSTLEIGKRSALFFSCSGPTCIVMQYVVKECEPFSCVDFLLTVEKNRRIERLIYRKNESWRSQGVLEITLKLIRNVSCNSAKSSMVCLFTAQRESNIITNYVFLHCQLEESLILISLMWVLGKC